MDTLEGASFAGQLRAYRLAAGLTQAELAGQSGLSLRAISDLERGVKRVPYPKTVALLARTLGLSKGETARLARTIPHRRGPRQPLGAGATAASSVTIRKRRSDEMST